MKRLHRFILKSFFGPFMMTFIICVFVLLMQFLWKYIDDLVGKGLEWTVVLELLVYASMALVPMAFPLAMLLASIMTFGNLGENYELVAMKASGVSLFKIMRPLLYFAIFLTFFAFYFSNNILPKTNLKFGSVMYSVRKQKPEMIINEGVFTNQIDGYSIKVEKKDNETGVMSDILIYDHTVGDGNLSVTHADSGYMNISDDKKFMVMTLFHGENAVDEQGSGRNNNRYEFRRNFFDKQIVTVPLSGFDFERTDEDLLRTEYKMMNLTQLDNYEDSLYKDYRVRVRNFIPMMSYNSFLDISVVTFFNKKDSLGIEYTPLISDSKAELLELYYSKDEFDRMETVSQALQNAQNNKQSLDANTISLYNYKKSLNKYTMEKYKKFSWPFACLIFFFIGAPLGAIIRKGGLGMPVVASIFMFIAYYVVTITGEKFAREDLWEMYNGMWLSSFVFLPIGFFLTYKAATDSSIMNTETYQYKLKQFFSFFFKKKKH